MSSAENFIYQSEQIIEYYVSSLKDSFNDKYFESNEFPNDTLQENSLYFSWKKPAVSNCHLIMGLELSNFRAYIDQINEEAHVLCDAAYVHLRGHISNSAALN